MSTKVLKIDLECDLWLHSFDSTDLVLTITSGDDTLAEISFTL